MEFIELATSRLVSTINYFEKINQFFVLVATWFANDSGEAKAAIHAFIKRTNIDQMPGYVEPKTILATTCKIPQHGWSATCYECGNTVCYTKISPHDENKLMKCLCSNFSEHENESTHDVAPDNDFLKKYKYKHPKKR